MKALRNQFADFREVAGQSVIESGEQQSGPLCQRNQIEVIPLAVAGHGLEGHGPGAVQAGRQKLVASTVRNQAGEAQSFGGRVERGKISSRRGSSCQNQVSVLGHMEQLSGSGKK